MTSDTTATSTAASDDLREIFITGLRNAHAMEKQALSIMEPQVARLENYPEMAQRLQSHIQETNGQIQRIDSILESLGDSSSALKDVALSVAGSMAAMGHTIAGDEVVKNSLANFAFENYELAAYSTLITLADAGGFTQARASLEQNLAEEVAMADWIKSHLPDVTLRFVQLREAGAQASH